MTSGTVSGLLIARYFPDLGSAEGAREIADQIDRDAARIATGDLSTLEHMLLGQAIALQAMFVDLASRAKGQDHRQWQHHHMTLALKCAAQSRQAISALAELRLPKLAVFAQQANVTTGPQQVNNSTGKASSMRTSRAHKGKVSTGQTELLEDLNGQRMDATASNTTVRTDPCMETVGAVNRPTHS